MFFLLLMALSLLPLKSKSDQTAISQWIYEDQIKRKCEAADNNEVDRLRRCFNDKFKTQLSDLDETSEYLVFHQIADSELNKISCSLKQTELIANDTKIQESAIDETCHQLPVLQKIWRTKESISQKITSFEKMNDFSVRTIPIDESRRRGALIQKLNGSLELIKKLETSLRGSDSLLRSPSVFEYVQEKFKNTKMQNKEACTILKQQIPDLLKQDIKELSKSRDYLKNSFNNGAWKHDISLKKTLWQFSGNDLVFTKLKNDSKLQKSILCRLEGRYGQGAKTYDALTNIAWVGLTFAMGPLAEIAATESAISSGGKLAKYTSNILDASVIGSDVYLSASQTIEACKDQITALAGPGSCDSHNTKETKSLYYKRLEGGHCALNASMGIVTAGLAGLGLKKINSTSNEVSKMSQIETLSEKELNDQFAEILTMIQSTSKEKIANNSSTESLISENTSKAVINESMDLSPPRYTKVDQSNEQLYLWHLRETGQTEKATKLEAELLNSMNEGSFKSVKDIDEGASGAKLVTLSDDRLAVWKPYEAMGANGQHEIAAAIVDRKLDRNRVPLVVEKYYGDKRGTLHLFVKGKDEKKLDNHPVSSLMFDSLIANRDRHGGNYFTVDERPIEIDHGLLFSPRTPNRFTNETNDIINKYEEQLKLIDNLENQLKRVEKVQPQNVKNLNRAIESEKKMAVQMFKKSSYRISMMISDRKSYELLKSTSPQEWEHLLKDKIKPYEFNAFLENREKILKAVENAREKFGDDVFPAGDFSPIIRGK